MCRCFYIPNIYFDGYFPQVVGNAHNVDVGIEQNGRFPYGDRFVDAMAENGASADEIIHAIMSEEFISKKDILQGIRYSFDNLREREKDCAVKISDYLEEHYKERQLMFRINHPTNECIFELVCRILKALGYEAVTIDHDNELVTEMLIGQDTPIYPCVRAAIGLDENCCLEAYANKYLWSFRAGLEEFTRKYLEVCWGIQ